MRISLRLRPIHHRTGRESDHALSIEDVVVRLKSQSSSHYLDLYNVIKGVTLGVAGVSFLNIAVPHWFMGRFLLWVVAFEGAVLTYYGAVAGATLLNRRPSLPDILFPMLLSVSELVLIYRPGLGLYAGLSVERRAESMPTDWFAFLAVWDFMCGLVIISVSRGLKSSIYDDTLRPVADAYGKRLNFDRNMALGTGLATLALFFLWLLPSPARWTLVQGQLGRRDDARAQLWRHQEPKKGEPRDR